jgi:hypothetical protein
METRCYHMFMPKQPISVTLEEENVLWLRGRTVAGRRRSLSDALDRIVTAARTHGDAAEARSVVGTVDIAGADPALLHADAAVRAMFDAAVSPAGPRPAAAPARRKGAGRKAAARG